MDQSCPVVHKSRRPQARLQTAKLFCNKCVPKYVHVVITLLFLPALEGFRFCFVVVLLVQIAIRFVKVRLFEFRGFFVY
jgi:hypothetical protein